MPVATVGAGESRPGETLGTPVHRGEDPHLLTGDARYAGDVQHPPTACFALLPNRYGHARIESVDAATADGTLAAITAATADGTLAAITAATADGTLAVCTDGNPTADGPVPTVDRRGSPAATETTATAEMRR